MGCKYQAEIPERLAEGEPGRLGVPIWGEGSRAGEGPATSADPPLSSSSSSSGESDNRNQQKMEMKVWDPDNPLTDRQIDQFLVVAR